MATEKRYMWSADTSATSRVTALIDLDDRRIVRVAATVFHPQGGGQRADAGAIGGRNVLDVRHAEDGEVDHMVESLAGLSVGQEVVLEVDRGVRRLHARLHTAGHLLADAGSLVASNLVGRAGHHWPNEARVEFDGSVVDADAFSRSLAAKLDELIADDLPVAVMGDAGSVRAIRICGAAVPCGGTHVASLGEIGRVAIRRVQMKGGRVRVGYGVEGERAP